MENRRSEQRFEPGRTHGHRRRLSLLAAQEPGIAAIPKKAVILSEAFSSGAEGPAFPSLTSVMNF
jgi:hypothetical protein